MTSQNSKDQTDHFDCKGQNQTPIVPLFAGSILSLGHQIPLSNVCLSFASCPEHPPRSPPPTQSLWERQTPRSHPLFLSIFSIHLFFTCLGSLPQPHAYHLFSLTPIWTTAFPFQLNSVGSGTCLVLLAISPGIPGASHPRQHLKSVWHQADTLVKC